MKLVAALAIALFVTVGDTRVARGIATQAAPVTAGGYRLYPAPTRLANQCRRAQAHVGFRVLCPTLLPRAKDGTRPNTYAQWADFPKDVKAAWLYAGGNYGLEADPQHWEWNNPNLFLHFVVLQGKLTATQLELSGFRPPQTVLGPRMVAGHRGMLYQQAAYRVCGCGFGGHITFVWHQNGATYAASLHRWSPKQSRSVLAVLTALIDHLEPV
jgi:hypothetical protein